MALRREAALTRPPARAGAVEDGKMLRLEVRGALEGHGPAAISVGGVDLGSGEAERAQHVEGDVVELLWTQAEHAGAERLAQGPFVEGELDVEGAGQSRFQRLERAFPEALGTERLVVDPGRALERAVADGIADHVLDLGLAIAQGAERLRHRVVDDPEIAAAGERLELHQREVGLDAGGVAVHHQADGAGRRDHRGLGVAVAMKLAGLQRAVPCPSGRRDQLGVGTRSGVQRHRAHRKPFVVLVFAPGGAAVVANDAQHRLAVVCESGERAQLFRHFRRGGVGRAGHERGDRGGERAALVAVIGQARGHQEAADVGVAQAQGAVSVGQLGDPPGRELGHQHRDLEHDRPQPHGVLEGRHVEPSVLAPEGHQVERGQIARRVVEEHVLRARVGGVDPAAHRAGVPFIDGGVELEPGVGRGPGGVADLLPQVPGSHGLGDLAVGAADEIPFTVGLHLLQEGVGDAHRVVGVLPGDGKVGFRIPVGVVGLDLDAGIALGGELNGPLDVVLRDHRLARGDHRGLELRVASRVEARLVLGAAVRGVVAAGRDDGVQALVRELGARDHRRDLLLLRHFPVDERLDVGVVDVDGDHLGGAPGGAAGLDGARGPVADFEEAHQPRRLAATRQGLVLGPERGEVGSGAGAVLEQPRLAQPQIHDAALVDQVVPDALDETGVRLGVLVGRCRGFDLAGPVVDVVVAIGRPVDAIGPVEPGVEPLGRVGRRHLPAQHVAELVEEGAGIRFPVEIAALPAPIGPGAGEPVEHLGGPRLAGGGARLVELSGRRLVGDMAPEPSGHVRLLDRLHLGRHAGLAEVFLGQDVDGDLGPRDRRFDVAELENDRAVRIADLARGFVELDAVVGRLPLACEQALNPHRLVP